MCAWNRKLVKDDAEAETWRMHKNHPSKEKPEGEQGEETASGERSWAKKLLGMFNNWKQGSLIKWKSQGEPVWERKEQD